jgi:chromosome segregation ATPase
VLKLEQQPKEKQMKVTQAVENLIKSIENRAEVLGVLDEVLNTFNLYHIVERQEALDFLKTTAHNRDNQSKKQETNQMLVVDAVTKETVNVDASEVAEFTTVKAAKAKAKAKAEPKQELVAPTTTKLNSLLDKRAALAKQLAELDAEIEAEAETIKRQQTKVDAEAAPKVSVSYSLGEAVAVAKETKATKTKTKATKKAANPKTSHTTKVIRATAKAQGIDVSEFNFKSSIDRAKAAMKCGLVG